ncbi:MAG TPA: serine hydrolase domain-containing protein [Actinomycetota bacterium]|nr:serine hydrolase domain-containing protein [Actinomycetota bacterium]
MKPPDRDAVVARLHPLMARLGRRRGVRHVALGASAVDGSWTWADAAGAADADGEPMGADTPWFIASVTKLHIAAVILRLHEQGHIDLHAPIASYLPEEFGERLHVHDGVDRTSEITAVHLLGHLSGLPDYLEEKPPDGTSLVDQIVEGPDRGWTPEDAARRARDQLSPHFPPSDPHGPRPRIRYSDTNYQLLLIAAGHVTGQPRERLDRELLFNPLSLDRTWLPGHDSPEPVVEPATVFVGGRALDDRPLAMASFGDLYSTTDDLLRFGRSLLTGDLFDDSRTVGLMRERFNRFGLPRSVASLRSPSWPIEYGLGLMRFELSRPLAGGRRLPTVVGHTGSTGSWLWHVPELDLVVAGTVDQTSAATVPFRSVPRALASI